MYFNVISIHFKILLFISIIFLLYFLIYTPLAYAGTIIRAPNNLGLVGYWPMDEGTGEFVQDHSGFGNHGTSSPPGSSAEWTAGRIGRALNFDGNNDQVGIGEPATLKLTGSATWSAWIKMSELISTKEYAILSKNKAITGNRGWELLIQDNPNLFRIAITDGSAANINRRSNMAPETGRWYHVVGVYNASAQTLDIYINGALDNGTLTGSVPTSMGDFTQTVAIGNRAGENKMFPGVIDDVRIYNRALSADEVQKLFQSGSFRRAAVSEQGLIGWWKMDEGQGTLVGDSSGNGLHGTTTATWVNGKNGKALQFNGNTDPKVVSMGDVKNFNGLSTMTFAAWIKPDSNDEHNILSKLNIGTTQRSFKFRLDNGTVQPTIAMYFSADGGGTNEGEFETGEIIPLNQWSHVAVTVNLSTETAVTYLNGKEVSNTKTEIGTGLPSSIIDTPAYLFISGQQVAAGVNAVINGVIDDVRAYNRVLSANEVQKLYQSGSLRRTAVSEQGLVGWWKMDEGQGTLVGDSSGNGLHATSSPVAGGGGPTWVAGKFGKGLLFDGVDDTANIGAPSQLTDLNTNFTISVWVKMLDLGDDLTGIIAKGKTTATPFIGMRFDSISGCAVNPPCFVWRINDGTNNAEDSFGGVTTGKWYHLAMVVGVRGASGLLGYVDGKKVVDVNTTSVGTISSAAEWFIGLNQRSNNARINAIMDDVRIYNRALSEEEVRKLYQGGIL